MNRYTRKKQYGAALPLEEQFRPIHDNIIYYGTIAALATISAPILYSLYEWATSNNTPIITIDRNAQRMILLLSSLPSNKKISHQSLSKIRYSINKLIDTLEKFHAQYIHSNIHSYTSAIDTKLIQFTIIDLNNLKILLNSTKPNWDIITQLSKKIADNITQITHNYSLVTNAINTTYTTTYTTSKP
jgi:hypothetical protein